MYSKDPLYRIFNGFNIVFLSILSLVCVMPLVHVFAVSLSSNAAATANLVTFWPIGFNLDSYERTFGSPSFLHALQISVYRTVLGTALSMLLCLLAAYPMSKEGSFFKGRTVYAWYFVITILFNGGLIPTYIIVNETGLRNTIWALVLPGAVAVFNVVLMMNFFRGIPKELDEAAQIDGASHARILFTVYLPISMPSIATLSLFSIVSHWNSWFDGMIYMEADIQPLATMIQSLVKSLDYTRIGIDPTEVKRLSERSLRATQIFIGALPVLVAYPFLQKYFVKGMTLGSVKE
ncbi:carbohydrate ABC transporter permease [Paenibacillus sepulcri]|uniref:Carbohydrate ABC transporter permease n=1 Tax=Paenibacillus sepulcri TaxID=359917 RepID=A0ABS7BYF7_9BACL|nr:carbohydrate ABC transporter permease [Paenibacillus sepulcri]